MYNNYKNKMLFAFCCISYIVEDTHAEKYRRAEIT